MSLVHIVVTKVTGYDLFTLYFDDREEEQSDSGSSFSFFEKEFAQPEHYVQPHPEYTYSVSYYGYFIFPEISAEDVYNLYRTKCESRPVLKRRYNIYFDKEHVHLEDMIKKFDRPMATHFDAKHNSYSHRLEYFERSIQILRDMQTAIYERETEIALKQLELHKKYKQSGSCTGDD